MSDVKPAPLTAEELDAFRAYYSNEYSSNADFDIRTLLAHIAHQAAEIARLEARRPVITVNGDGEATEVTFDSQTVWKVSKPTAPALRAALSEANDLLQQIGDIAHDASTGPAIPDVYWDIRSIAYDGIKS